jgi:hypothetical protein
MGTQRRHADDWLARIAEDALTVPAQCPLKRHVWLPTVERIVQEDVEKVTRKDGAGSGPTDRERAGARDNP